jgi:ribosomal protein S27AE
MTREHRLVLSLDEIIGLRWTCGTCGVAISFPFDRTIRWPEQCPACGEHVSMQDPATVDAVQSMRALITALQAAVRVVRHPQLASATLSLEFVDVAGSR